MWTTVDRATATVTPGQSANHLRDPRPRGCKPIRRAHPGQKRRASPGALATLILKDDFDGPAVRRSTSRPGLDVL